MAKKILYLVYISILPSLLSCTIDNRGSMIPFEDKSSKWGYMDKHTQKKLISPSYDLAFPFINDQAIIGLNDTSNDNQVKYGLIDTLGNYLLQPVYDYIKFPSFGYYIVGKSGRINILNLQLLEMLPPKYKDVVILDQEYALVSNEVGEGLYNLLKQKEIIPTQYDEVKVYPSRFIKVKKGDKFGYFNKDGQNITPIKYDYPDRGDFDNGYLLVSFNGHNGIIDTTGNEFIPLRDKHILNFDPIYKLFLTCSGDKTNVYNMNNQLLFSGVYGGPSGTQGYHEGLMVFNNEKGFGFIDTKGRLAIPYIYDFIESFGFYNGFATVMKDNQIAVINKENKIVLPFTSEYYYKLLQDSSICIIDTRNKMSKLVDNKLEEVIPFKYSEIEYLGKGYYKVMLKDLYGMVDNFGNEILSVRYLEINNQVENIIPFVDTNHKYGFYNTITKQIIPSKYTRTKVHDIYLRNGFANIREDSLIMIDKTILIDKIGQEYVVKCPDYDIFN